MSDRRDREIKNMQRILQRLICALLTLVGISAADAADEKPLRIAFIAYQNPDQLIEDVRPVVAYLEETLQVSVKYFAATDYAGIVERMKAAFQPWYDGVMADLNKLASDLILFTMDEFVFFSLPLRARTSAGCQTSKGVSPSQGRWWP